jgi:hypothetical protein
MSRKTRMHARRVWKHQQVALQRRCAREGREIIAEIAAEMAAENEGWVDPRSRSGRRGHDLTWIYCVRTWSEYLGRLATAAAIAIRPEPEPFPVEWDGTDDSELSSPEALAPSGDRSPPAARSGWGAAVTLQAA